MAKWGFRIEWLGILAGVAFALASGPGCGGSSQASSSKSNKDGGQDASNADGNGGGGFAGSGGGSSVCQLAGTSCTSSTQCCSANCDPKSHSCVVAVGCKGAGATCSAATDCCTGVCTSGKCGNTLCTSDNKACSSNAQCCSGQCAVGDAGAKVCIPLNTSCSTSGNTCKANADCCSGVCTNGVCQGSVSYCRQTGDSCSRNAECCGDICTIASGKTLGTCGVPTGTGAGSCNIAGTVCQPGGATVCGDTFCCSHSCAPYGPTGVDICQPPSGCRPTGEVCAKDSDCCGGPGGDPPGLVTCNKVAGAKLGLCGKANAGGSGHKACQPAGSLCRLKSMSCSMTADCCAGNTLQTDTCQLDLLGIPRCTIKAGGCKGDAGSMLGQACASSADCCGLPCVPNQAGTGYVCGPSCQKQGGTCSTDADCCSGLPCIVPTGSSTGKCEQPPPPPPPDGGTTTDSGTTKDSGSTTDGGATCALYGQTCTKDSDCCNGVPCTSGRCEVIIK